MSGGVILGGTGTALATEGEAVGGGLLLGEGGAAALATAAEVLSGPVGWAILAGTVLVVGVSMYNAQQKAQSLKAVDTTQPCIECDEDPCEHLRKGNGKGKYRGGAHGETKGPANDGLDSHHTPAADANKIGGGPARNDGPAIQMEPGDHRNTMSFGSDADAKLYRAKQAQLIKEGKLLEATKMDIEDVKKIAKESGDPHKYDEALKEMQEYAECLQNKIDKK